MAKDEQEVGRRLVGAPAAALILVVVAVALTIVLPGAVAQEPAQVGDANAGRQVFASNCAACHGAAAQGRGSAPALIGVVDHHSVDEVETVIRRGRGGMPAFDARLSDAEIDDVLAFLAVAPADEAAPSPGPHMDRWWDGMMWHGAGAAPLLWIVLGVLLLVALAVGIVWLLRQVSSGGGRPPRDDDPSAPGPPSTSAREELDRRLARGEISREEYRAIRDDLEG